MTTQVIEDTRAGEQTRARCPHEEGFVERDGVRIFYEAYGDGEPTVLLMPTWSIIHSRFWKAQIPFLARHFRVVTFDGRGNGRSDRPQGVEAYVEREFAADALAVMDATGTERAALVALSCGALWTTLLAADHPERVLSAVYIGPAVPLAPGRAERAIVARYEDELDSDKQWAKYNRHYWQRDYLGFLEFFFAQMFSEPHSSRQIEDCLGWPLETDPVTLADTSAAMSLCGLEQFADVCDRVRCPVLVIHGAEDRIRPLAQGAALAHRTGGELVTLAGAGHGPQARDPVKVNLLLRDFIALQPDLEIDWLAQDPVTRVLAAEGERIHPASALPASESGHMESESAEHDLHCFRAWRRMDEILVAYRHLAARDLAVVQGGLTTAMELTANKRPFLCFPLRHHFEQNLHVRHRVERYGGGRYMDFETDGLDEIAVAIAEEIGREVDYRDVETDGAARAAAAIAELL